MAWQKTKPMPPDRACWRCHERYRQLDGLCYTCAREVGRTIQSRREQERQRVDQERAKLEALYAQASPDAPRCYVINGIEYEVVWDGRRRGGHDGT